MLCVVMQMRTSGLDEAAHCHNLGWPINRCKTKRRCLLQSFQRCVCVMPLEYGQKTILCQQFYLYEKMQRKDAHSLCKGMSLCQIVGLLKMQGMPSWYFQEHAGRHSKVDASISRRNNNTHFFCSPASETCNSMQRISSVPASALAVGKQADKRASTDIEPLGEWMQKARAIIGTRSQESMWTIARSGAPSSRQAP